MLLLMFLMLAILLATLAGQVGKGDGMRRDIRAGTRTYLEAVSLIFTTA